jgi:hypothetical protein
MKITWYGHSCFHLETGYSTFIEPFREDKPTIVTLGIAWRETTGARLPAASRMWRSRRAMSEQGGEAAEVGRGGALCRLRTRHVPSATVHWLPR